VAAKEEVRCGDREYRDAFGVSISKKSLLGTVQREEWFVPGVGMLKRIERGRLHTAEIVLTSYELGAQAAPLPAKGKKGMMP
jgi:hypothetical protein